MLLRLGTLGLFHGLSQVFVIVSGVQTALRLATGDSDRIVRLEAHHDRG